MGNTGGDGASLNENQQFQLPRAYEFWILHGWFLADYRGNEWYLGNFKKFQQLNKN